MIHAKTSLPAVAAALLLAGTHAPAAESAAESFHRMLAQRPAAGAMQADAVAASFHRMLSHTPSLVAPPVPAGFGKDPLDEAWTEPLRRRLAAEGRARQRP